MAADTGIAVVTDTASGHMTGDMWANITRKILAVLDSYNISVIAHETADATGVPIGGAAWDTIITIDES